MQLPDARWMRWCSVVLGLVSSACHSGDDLTPASGGAAGASGTGASGGAGGSGGKGGTGGTGATGGSGGSTGGASGAGGVSGSGGSGGDTGGTGGATGGTGGATGGTGGATGGSGGATGGTGGTTGGTGGTGGATGGTGGTTGGTGGATGGTGGATGGTGGTGGATGGTGGCGDTTSSISNCGSCGGVCSNINNSAQSCSAGLCSYTCNSGFASCDAPQPGASDDGCETNINTSASNCGSCGGVCSNSNSSAQSCFSGLCSYTCNSGFSDCTGPQPGASDDGCETNINTSASNCGSCGGVCSNANNSAQSCSAGLCSYTCNGGFADCTGPQPGASDDGCETNINTSASNCGSCGGACSSANNSAQSCSGGTCSYTCNSGFANCNGAQPGASDDGCETNTASDPSHCGNCTTTCTGATVCAGGSCVPSWLTGLVAYWKLDEASGTRMDSVGANHLTSVNGVGAQAGKVSQAAAFTSASGHDLTIADNPALSIGNVSFTIAAWVRLNDTGNNYFVAKEGTSPGFKVEYVLGYSAAGFFTMGLCDDASTCWGIQATSAGAATPNTWYFVVAWNDNVAGTVSIQVNDGAVQSTAAGGIPVDTSYAFHIGRTPFNLPPDGMDGLVDEVAFWKRVLTAAERADLYNGGAGRTLP